MHTHLLQEAWSSVLKPRWYKKIRRMPEYEEAVFFCI